MPKVVDHDTRKNELAAAAVTVIARMGVENMRLTDVAREIGATTGMVTHYLGDKDSVLKAALEYVADELLENSNKGESTNLEMLWESLYNALPTSDRSLTHWAVWLAFWSRASQNPELAKIHQRYNKKFQSSIMRDLQRILPPSAFSSTCPEDMASAVIAAVDGVSLHAIIDPDVWPATKLRRQLTLMLAPILRIPETLDKTTAKRNSHA